MGLSILHRYVLRELLKVFALALVAITGILVMAGVVAEAAQQGLGPEQIIKIIPFIIPPMLPFTVPATTLFAVSVVYGRLSHDNEITAVKAAGIPVTVMVWPALLVGLSVSAIMFGLHVSFIPRSQHLLRTTAIKDIEELIYTVLRKELCFNRPEVNYSIHVTDVQGRRLIHPTFKRRDNLGRDEIIAQAKEAEIKVDVAKQEINIHMTHADISKDGGQTSGNFEKEVFPLPMPALGTQRKTRAREMSNRQILEHRDELERQIAELRGEAAPAPARDDKPAPSYLLSPEQKVGYLQHDVWELDTEYQMRPSISLSSLFFVLIGCPVAVWFHKRDYLSAFVTCFLPIILVYYPLMMFGLNLSKEGKLNPTLAMWVGNSVLGAAGLVLFRRLLRH